MKEYSTHEKPIRFSLTNKHQYLLTESCHTKHIKSAIPNGQALRVRRICLEESNLKKNTQGWRIGRVTKIVRLLPQLGADRRGFDSRSLTASFFLVSENTQNIWCSILNEEATTLRMCKPLWKG